MKRDKFIKEVRKLYSSKARVYGPYVRKSDGRRIVLIYWHCKNTTKLYAKVKLEIKLHRILGSHETVDHKDEDITNDKTSNLQLLSRKRNKLKNEHTRFGKRLRCPQCNKRLRSRVKAIRNGKRSKNKFCSRSCQGKYYGNQYTQRARVAQRQRHKT